MRVRTATANAVRIALYFGSAVFYSSFHPGDGTYRTLTVTATADAAVVVGPIVYFAASCTAYLDNAMLVVGSVPADYAPLHPADDLARCLRYYEIPVALGIPRLSGNNGANNNIPYYLTIPFRVPKPVSPTITMVGTWTYAGGNGAPTLNSPSIIGVNAGIAVNAGVSYDLYPPAGGLTVEANP